MIYLKTYLIHGFEPLTEIIAKCPCFPPNLIPCRCLYSQHVEIRLSIKPLTYKVNPNG